MPLFDYKRATISALEYGSKCRSEAQDGSEDCLTVNVNVAKSVLESGEKVPIVVYIHGGGFNVGSNQREFDRLIDTQNVMVVSMNYRLGIYGFLYSSEAADGEEFTGNWGLLDQQVALRWVHEFAGAFGGDTVQGRLNTYKEKFCVEN